MPSDETRYACLPEVNPLPRSFNTWRTRLSLSPTRSISSETIASTTANSGSLGQPRRRSYSPTQKEVIWAADR